jgi:hypothetical protein
MKTVTVDREGLKTILADNRTKHVADVAEARQDYNDACLKIAQTNLRVAEAQVTAVAKNEMGGLTFKYERFPSPPEDHTRDYDRVLRMLDLSVDSNVVLESREFENLVMDNWEWKEQFRSASIAYKAMASGR